MKVIVAINGTVTAESMAFYALKYAQVQNFSLVLLHIKNIKDSMSDVELSMDRIDTIAISENIQTERIILEGSIKEAIKNYLEDIFADIIFCSTRKDENFIKDSFSLQLTKMNLNVDIAIVRVVKMSNNRNLSRVMLSIREDKLSVKKFTFFSSIVSAYKADAEIYSVSSMSRAELSRTDIHEARERLSLINYNLRHYMKLSHIMKYPLTIKHDFTNNEAKSIFTHIVKSNAQLVIIGAKRLSVKSFFKKEMPIEKLMSEASINTIAYYPKED